MIDELLTPREVDLILRYPAGRTARLVRKGMLPHVTLPDGAIRFTPQHLEEIIGGVPDRRKGMSNVANNDP